MWKKKSLLFLGALSGIIIYFSVTTTIPFGNGINITEVQSADVFC